MNPDELHQRIDELLDDAISEADFLRLEAHLHVDPKAREAYYARTQLDLLLETEAQAAGPTLEKTVSPSRPTRWQSTRAWIPSIVTTAAAVVTLGAVTALLWTSPPDPVLTRGPEAQAQGYAILASEADAVWESSSSISAGSLMPAGRIALKAGAAQMELFSGVSIVVEAGAEFEILSSMEMAVHRGKVRARVPEPAQGFRIHTPEGDIVDLGTEFALDVGEERSEIHVIEGEIEWHEEGSEVRSMTDGQALRLNADGRDETLAASGEAFLGLDQLRDQSRQGRLARRERWMASSQELSQDPDTVLHYRVTPSEAWNRRIANLGAGSDASAGTLVAAASSQNRFGEPDSALDFRPTGSRVRLQVPGEFGSLTLLCWVQVNSLDRWYNSLFLTDGHELGEPHWQIMDDGRMFFSVKRNEWSDRDKGVLDKHIFYSPSIADKILDGQWAMLATVYDLEKNEVLHTLNGEVISRESIPAEYRVDTVRIGAASIGNWSLPMRDDPDFAVRNLNGHMDEFLLLGRALSPTEIAEIHQQGRP